MLSIENLTIWLWAGSIAAIPPGFVLCDGTNGTPDLRDRFVLGAGDTFAVDEVNGVTVHNHAFTGDGHTHSLPGIPDLQGGAGFSTAVPSETAAGTTDNDPGTPPFYSLAYLMKID